jgi:hypothetical protein
MRPDHAGNPDALIALSQGVATHFAVIATAKGYCETASCRTRSMPGGRSGTASGW